MDKLKLPQHRGGPHFNKKDTIAVHGHNAEVGGVDYISFSCAGDEDRYLVVSIVVICLIAVLVLVLIGIGVGTFAYVIRRTYRRDLASLGS